VEEELCRYSIEDNDDGLGCAQWLSRFCPSISHTEVNRTRSNRSMIALAPNEPRKLNECYADECQRREYSDKLMFTHVYGVAGHTQTGNHEIPDNSLPYYDRMSSNVQARSKAPRKQLRQ
jgi:hypothetical protein